MRALTKELSLHINKNPQKFLKVNRANSPSNDDFLGQSYAPEKTEAPLSSANSRQPKFMRKKTVA